MRYCITTKSGKLAISSIFFNKNGYLCFSLNNYFGCTDLSIYGLNKARNIRKRLYHDQYYWLLTHNEDFRIRIYEK